MKYTELLNYNGKFDPVAKTELVFYHENCVDGSCSAGLHAAMKKAAAAKGESADNTLYCSVRYGNESEAVKTALDTMSEYGVKGISALWVLDFHFGYEVMKDIYCGSGYPDKIVYLDHHKTAKEDLENFRDWVITNCSGCRITARFGDRTQSGASMTYDYILAGYDTKELAFAAANKNGYMHIKELVDTCVDYDLWTHNNPDTMGIITGIMAEPLPVSKWADMLLDYSAVRSDYLSRGLGIIAQQKYTARQLAENRRFPELEYNGSRIAMLNIPPQWVNIVSDELLANTDCDAVLSYSITGREGSVNVSMRAGKNRDLDCGEFMKTWFNGGGHPAAAGGRCGSIGEYFGQIENIRDIAENKETFYSEVN